MLKLWRRHLSTCAHQAKGRDYIKCACPIWADGMLDGRRVRKSLDTLDWQRANQIIREMEAEGKEVPDCSIADAVKKFITDCEKRNLADESVRKYKEALNPLVQYCEAKPITKLVALDLPTLRTYVRELTDSPLTVSKKIERLRTFFTFCEEEGWIEKNPAKKIKGPKVTNAPVVPFTTEQYQSILAAIDEYPAKNSYRYDARKRLRAFVYTLRYTAFRIADATKLKKSSVSNGRVLIRTMKTGANVHLPLPPFALTELDGLGNDRYFFWSGNGTIKSAKAAWQRTLTRLFKLAGVDGHPHMFRHMMAIELLEKGVSVEHVAAILGNTPAIVYKHYAPWVASRQKALEEAVAKIW